ncbi:MAG: hypothetical protein HOW73_41055 [Polyangiaceae bacterium]|nr:hypothetical protein [Polyangiaceae bacterium]
MGFTQGTSRALQQIGEYQNRQKPVPVTPATSGRSSDLAREPQEQQKPPAKPSGGDGGKGSEGCWGLVGKGFATALKYEKQLSEYASTIPYAGMPASRKFDNIMGIPHAHGHPPNAPPPPPQPLPSAGPILPIPYVSCADKTLINGSSAARCGDLGASVWCGSYAPVIEVFMGSASVWIESARAARALDVTNHCTLKPPKPTTDPAIYLPVGVVASGSGNVFIGGVQMPSLMGLALGAAVKTAAKAVRIGLKAAKQVAKTGYLAGRAMINAALKRLARNSTFFTLLRFQRFARIVGDEAFKKGVMADLKKIASTKWGRNKLNSLANKGQRLEIKSVSSIAPDRPMMPIDDLPKGPCAWPDNFNCQPKYVDAPNSPWWDNRGRNVLPMPDSPGPGSGSTVYYDPGQSTPLYSGGQKFGDAPSDVTLAHELNHADNFAGGTYTPLHNRDGNWNKQWSDLEEFNTVQNENAYRGERGLPYRPKYF